ncbi:MAG TPA: hypothetical protein VGN35_10975 [Jatrophihabitantaceae bacterium]|nr:hypothetical protein [Jatrophihabitantaceae bacterium]
MTIGFAGRRARHHRGLFWSAVVVALALLVGGAAVAYSGYSATAGPDGAVRGYFAALRRGDAPAALAFGDIPTGPRMLLSRTVLREQLRVAPIQDVGIVSVARTSPDTARVTVRYTLRFHDFTPSISDSTVVVRRNGTWRLAASAVLVRIDLAQAGDRATLAGLALPADPVLMFPGAIPMRFDTPYLQLEPSSGIVQLNSQANADLSVTVTPSGAAAVLAALQQALPACLAGAPAAAPTCPRPSPRAVPGSLRGSLQGPLKPTISVATGSSGMIDVTARATVDGSYQLLNFNNIALTERGRVTLPLQASAFAVSPIRLTWADDAP